MSDQGLSPVEMQYIRHLGGLALSTGSPLYVGNTAGAQLKEIFGGQLPDGIKVMPEVQKPPRRLSIPGLTC